MSWEDKRYTKSSHFFWRMQREIFHGYMLNTSTLTVNKKLKPEISYEVSQISDPVQLSNISGSKMQKLR